MNHASRLNRGSHGSFRFALFFFYLCQQRHHSRKYVLLLSVYSRRRFILRHIEIPCIPPHCLVFYNSSISFLPGTLSAVHRPSVLSHSGFLIGTFHTWKYHWLTRQCPSRGLGASMGNNLSPLDIRSHALFLLDFVLWKWQTPFSVSEQMRKVVRLEKAKV